MEVDPDLIHPKWGHKQAAKKDAGDRKPPAKTKQASSKENKQQAARQPQQETHGKKQGKQPQPQDPTFNILKTPYGTGNMKITGSKHASRMSRGGSNMIYFDRHLGNGESLSLRVESFGEPETVNMVFGVTTCNAVSVSTHTCHIKSFCKNDGRPCGGRSLTCSLDRSVRGSETLSFKKVPEGIEFLADGFLVTQFKDKESIFKHKKAFPFVALTGDVAAISVVDPSLVRRSPAFEQPTRSRNQSERTSVSESPLTLPSAPTLVPKQQGSKAPAAAKQSNGKVTPLEAEFEEIQTKKKKKLPDDCRYTFLKTSHMASHLELQEKNRLVVRKTTDVTQLNAVYLNRELTSDRRLVLQIEKVNNTIDSSKCFTIGVTTCDAEQVKLFSCHARASCFKTECKGFSASFNILKCKNNSSPGTLVVLERRESGIFVGAGDWFRTPMPDAAHLFISKRAYPFVHLNGTVVALKIIEDPERFSAQVPVVARPLAASVPRTNSLSPPLQPLIKQFVVPFYAENNMRLSNNQQTVTRDDYQGPRMVTINSSIEVGDRLALVVESTTSESDAALAFQLALTVCDLSSSAKIKQHGPGTCSENGCGGRYIMKPLPCFACTGSRVLVERKPFLVNVTIDNASGVKQIVMETGGMSDALPLFPYLVLSGTVDSIRIACEEPAADAAVAALPPLVSQLQQLAAPFEYEQELEGEQLYGLSTDSPEEVWQQDVLPTSHPLLHSLQTDKMMQYLPQELKKPNVPPMTNEYSYILNSFDDYHRKEEKDRSTPTEWDDLSVSLGSEAAVGAHPGTRQQSVSSDSSSSNGSNKVAVEAAPPVLRERKWYGNMFVSFKGGVMTRVGEVGNSCCLFGESLSVGQGIRFRVTQVDTRLTGSVAFGLTKLPLVQVDLEEIPTESSRGDWFLQNDVLPVVLFDEEIQIRRSESAVSLERSGVQETLFSISAGDRVYPFLRFNGAISQLRLLT